MKNIKDQLFNRWGIRLFPIVYDGSKYGATDDDAWTRNEVLGIVKVSEIKEAERIGAIAYVDKMGSWKVKSEWFLDPGTGKKRIGVSKAFLKWKKNRARTSSSRKG